MRYKKLAMLTLSFLLAFAVLITDPVYADVTKGGFTFRLIKHQTDLPTEIIERMEKEVYYTPYGLVEFHMPILLRKNTAGTLCFDKSDFSSYYGYLKNTAGMDRLQFKYLSNETIQVEDSYICDEYGISNNSAICMEGHQTYKPDWELQFKSIPSSVCVQPNRWYIIDIIGYKKADVQDYWSVDLVPKFKTIELPEFAWWNSTYGFKRLIEPDSTVATDQFALMNYTIDTASLISAGKMRSDCRDLRFTYGNESTLVPYEWVGYSSSVYGCNQSTTIVELNPLIETDNSTQLYIYYDASGETTWGNSTDVYKDYSWVFNFGEGTGSTTLEAKTKTSGTITGSRWLNQINDGSVESVGHSLEFDGNDNVNFGDNFDITGSLTMMIWTQKPNLVPASTYDLMGKHDGSRDSYWWLIGGNGVGGGDQLSNCIVKGNDAWSSYESTNLGWNFMSCTFNSSHVTHYINGTVDNYPTSAQNPTDDDASFYFGYETQYGTDYVGNITLARISEDVKTDDFLKLAYDIIRYSDSLVTIGAEIPYDVTPPNVTFVSPVNQIYNSTSVWVNVTTNESATGCNRSIDLGSNISMSNTSATNWYNLTSGLAYGSHNVTVYCADASDNIGSRSQDFSVNAPPFWSNNQSTGFPAIYTTSPDWYTSVLWNDDQDANGFSSGIFSTNLSGSWVNFTATRVNNQTTQHVYDIPAGTIAWRYYANDSAGFWNVTDQWYSVCAKATPTCTLTITPATPIVYETNTTASCSCDSTDGGYTVKMYRNGTDVTSQNATVISLGAGGYNYSCNITETANYTIGYTQENYVVNQQTPTLSLGADPSWSAVNGTTTTVTGSGCPAQINCTLYRNDTGAVSNPDVQTLPVGSYNYTYNTTGNVNYTTTATSNNLVIFPSGTGYSIVSNYYEGDVIELDTANFTIVINITNTTMFTSVDHANLTWNGTVYTGVDAGNVSSLYTFYYLLPIPDIEGLNATVTHQWSFLFIGGSEPNTTDTATAYNQNIHQIYLGNCTDGVSSTVALRFNGIDEETDASVNFTFDADFTIWKHAGNLSNYSFNFTDNSTYEICLYPAFTDFTTQTLIEYTASGYTQRFYYLDGATINNATNVISLYLLNTSEATLVTIEVLDEVNDPEEDILIWIQRQDVGEGTFTQVAEGLTDFNGQAYVYLKLYEYYKFYLTRAGTILQEYDPFYLTTNSLTFHITEASIPEYFSYYDQVATSCLYNNDTSNLTCSYIDSSGLSMNMTLEVVRHGYRDTVIYTDISNDASKTWVVHLDANYSYGYTMIGTYYSDPQSYVWESGTVDLTTRLSLGLVGLFLGSIIVMMAGCSAYFDPKLAVVLTPIAMGIVVFLGLITVGVEWVAWMIIMAVIGGVIGYKL